jgi:hypothetical protein
MFITFICFLQGAWLTFILRKFKDFNTSNILKDTMVKFIYFSSKTLNMLTLMTCNGYLILFNVLGIAIGDLFFKEKEKEYLVEEKMCCNVC